MSTTVSSSKEYPAKLDSKISYQRAGKQQQASLNAALRDLSTFNLFNAHFNGQVECSEWAQKGAKVHFEQMANQERLATKLECSWGRQYKNGNLLSVIHVAQMSNEQPKKELKSSIEIHYEPNDFHHKGEAIFKKIKAETSFASLKLSHKNLKDDQQSHEANMECLHDGKISQFNGKVKCSKGTKSVNIRVDRAGQKTIKATARYENSQAAQNPVFEIDSQVSPLEAQVEIKKANAQLIKLQGSYERKRATDVTASALVHYKNQQIAKATAARKDDKIDAMIGDMKGNTAEFKAEIGQSAVFDLKSNNEPVYQLLLKTSPAADNGVLYEVKSLTKRGQKKIPDVLIELEPKKMRGELQIKGDYYVFITKAQKSNQLPKASLLVSFDCRKHRNVHQTEISMDGSKYQLTSKHAHGGEVIYDFQALHEKTAEGRKNNLKLKAGRETEITANHEINPREMTFDANMSGQHELEFSLSSVKGSKPRVIRSAVEPAFTKVRMIYRCKRDDTVFKTYAEYKNSPKALRLTSIEFSKAGQRKLLASANIARDAPVSTRMLWKGQSVDFEMDLWNEKKALKYEYKTSQAQGSFSGNLKIDNNRARIQGKMTHENKKRKDLKLTSSLDTEMAVNQDNVQGDLKIEWQHPRSSGQQKFNAFGRINKNLANGPHEVKICSGAQACSQNEARFTHQVSQVRGKSVSKTALLARRDGQKVIEVQLTGNSQQTDGTSVQLTADIDSERYQRLQGINYQVNIQKNSAQRSFEMQRSQNGKTSKLSLKRSESSAETKNDLSIEGYLADGTPAKFNAKSKCSDRCQFNAQLVQNNQEHSNMEVKLPLSRVSEFIPSQASARFNSPFFGTEAALEIDAQQQDNIQVRAHASANGQQIIAYRLQVTDGQSFRPYGVPADFQPQQRKSVLVEQELQFQGKPVADAKVFVSGEDMIAYKVSMGQRKASGTAWIKSSGQTEFYRRACTNDEQKCSQFKLVKQENGQKTNWNMEYKRQENYAEQFKLHAQAECDRTPNNRKFSLRSTIQDRAYGLSGEELVSSSKKLYKWKLSLPERDSEVHLEVPRESYEGQPRRGKLIIFHDTSKEDEKVVVEFQSLFKKSEGSFDTELTISHKSIQKPVKIQLKFAGNMNRNSRQSTLSISGKLFLKIQHDDKFLAFESSSEHALEDLKLAGKRQWRVYNQDKTIDFGCITSALIHTNRDTFQSQMNSGYKCEWTDRNQQIRTLEDTNKLSNKDFLELSIFSKNPFTLIKMISNVSIAGLLQGEIEAQIHEGSTVNLRFSSEKSESKKCLLVTAKSSASPKVYIGKSCISQELSIDEPIFQLKVQEKESEESLVNFTIVRLPESARAYKVSLKWSPTDVSNAVLGLLDFAEIQARRAQQVKEEIVEELKHKRTLIMDTVNKIRQPWNSYWSNELDRFSQEMQPETEAIRKMFPTSESRSAYRFPRSVNSFRDATSWVDQDGPLAVEWIVKDLEGGELEFIVRNFKLNAFPVAIAEALFKLKSGHSIY